MKLTNISNFNNIQDYLAILNGSILADIVVLLIVYYTSYFNSYHLMRWYESYRLSAIIADVLILMIGIIITRYIFNYFKLKWNIITFIAILLGVQITHDYLFYLFFKSIPLGMNKMLDLFKNYAKEVSIGAILGDSFMIIIAGLLSSYFAGFSLNTNIILLICFVYLIPYILYTK